MSAYFHAGLETNSRKVVVEEAVSRLANYEFDSIICRGRSGLCIAAIVAYLMNKTLVIVNKNGHSPHCNESVSYHDSPRVAIILDDFVSSGTTVRECYIETSRKIPNIKIVGIYLYKDTSKKPETIIQPHPKISMPHLNRLAKMGGCLVEGYSD